LDVGEYSVVIGANNFGAAPSKVGVTGRDNSPAAPASRRLPAVEIQPDTAVSGTTARRSAAGEFLTGLRLLGRGASVYARSPRLLVLGLVPAVIAALVVTVAFAVLIYFIGDLAALVTWFANDWSADLRSAVRILAGAAILGVAAVLAVLTYTALTLTIGDPFYESISRRVEEQYGGAGQEAAVPWTTSMRRNLTDSVLLIGMTAAVGVPVFLLGFIPVVGQIAGPVLDALVGGWFLAIELTGIPFNRRGLRLRDRRRLLAGNRALALGFGVPVFLVFLIPFAGVLVIPIAVAGGTLVARRALGLPHG
jgi:CysZ protein